MFFKNITISNSSRVKNGFSLATKRFICPLYYNYEHLEMRRKGCGHPCMWPFRRRHVYRTGLGEGSHERVPVIYSCGSLMELQSSKDCATLVGFASSFVEGFRLRTQVLGLCYKVVKFLPPLQYCFNRVMQDDFGFI